MDKEKDKRNFLALNYDNAQEFLQPGDYTDALNIRSIVTDQGNDGILENSRGTTSKFAELGFSLPSGTNKCVASLLDEQNNRVIWLNYNSNNSHGIYCYNSNTNTIQTIMVTAVLNFQQNINIYSIDIMNNILIWTDNFNPQRKVYVNSALQGQYGNTIVEEMITDAKVCPSWPIKCTPVSTIGANNIKSLKSFQFIYRYVYFGGEKSVWSTVSRLVPTGYTGDKIQTITLDISDCELFTNVPLQKIVSFVEFASRELYTLNFNQFNRLTTAQVITASGLLNYFDTEAKTAVDTAETDMAFSEVPLLSGSVCFQDNREFSADTTEGYDYFGLTVTNVSQLELPASGGLPDVSDCDLHINQRYYKPDSTYQLSAAWYDEYGRKSGAINLLPLAFTTAPYRGNDAKANIIQFTLPLSNAINFPPWAVKLEVLRSANKSVVSFFQARANNVLYCTGTDPTTGKYTYKIDNPGPGNQNISDADTVELHVDISNLLQYGINIPYLFTEGDMITFITTGGNSQNILDPNSITSQGTSASVVESAAAPALQHLNILGTVGDLVRIDYSQAYAFNFNACANDPGNGNFNESNFTPGILVVGDNGFIGMGLYGFPGSNLVADLKSTVKHLQNLTIINLYACALSRGNGYIPIKQGGSGNLALIAGDGGNIWAFTATFDDISGNEILTADNVTLITNSKTAAIRRISYNNDLYNHNSDNVFWACGDGGLILRIAPSTATSFNPATVAITNDYSQLSYGNILGISSSYSSGNGEYAVACGQNGLLAYVSLLAGTGSPSFYQWAAITCNNINSICVCEGSTIAYIAVGDDGTILINQTGNLSAGAWSIYSGISSKANFYSVKQVTQYGNYGGSSFYYGEDVFIITGEAGATYIINTVNYPSGAIAWYDVSSNINVNGDIRDISIQADRTLTINWYGMIVGTKDIYGGATGIFVPPNSFTYFDFSSNITDLPILSYVLNWGAKFEIYTPITSSGAEDIFYEYGDAYAPGQDYTLNKGKDDDGDAFLIKKNFQGIANSKSWTVKGDVIFSMQPNSNNTTGQGIQTPGTNGSDTPTPWDLDWGRPNIVPLYPEVQERRNIIRYSDPYIQDSKVNGLSSYQETNYAIVSNSNGHIKKITPIKYIMLINCERETCTGYINRTIFNQSANQPAVTGLSAAVINNIETLEGGYGTYNPESIVEYFGEIYFFSTNNGMVCRYNPYNGIFAISDYKARTYFYGKVNDALPYAAVLGGYDPFFRSYMLTFNYQFAYTQDTTVFVNTGSEPLVEVYCPLNAYVYALNFGGASVTPINTVDNSTLPDIPVGLQPQSADFASSDNCIYVACAQSDAVYIINPTTQEAIGSISTIGSLPQGIEYYNNVLYVFCNGGGGTVDIIDANPSSGTYRTIIHSSPDLGGNTVSPTLNPAAGEIYVSSIASDWIAVVSMTDASLITTIALPASAAPRGTVLDTTHQRLYIICHGLPLLEVADVNPSSGTRYQLLGSGITLPASGAWQGVFLSNFVWIAGGLGNFLYGVDTTQGIGELIVVQPVGANPDGIIVNPNNNYLFISSSDDTVITIYDTVNKAVVNNIDVGFESRGLLFTPNNKIYAAIEGENQVAVIGGMVTPDTIAFNEDGNRWTSRFSFIPERYANTKNDMFSFLNGELWIHNSYNQAALYSNFYGVQYNASVKVVFNMSPSEQKNYENILAESTDLGWVISSIATQEGQQVVPIGTTLPMQPINKTLAKTIDFDINSPNVADPFNNGRFIQSNTLTVEFQNNNTTFATLRFVNVFSKRNERTDK